MAPATVSPAPSPTVDVSTSPTVRTCYDVLDVARWCGITDFTDGKYAGDGDGRAAYLDAQFRQAEYLLDQARCERGSRLLDVGCGYGRILAQATSRGANAVGITISAGQVAYCRARGLDAQLLDYRQVFARGATDWEAAFDCIIANGSLEHFVQVDDATAGRADDIYRELFSICRRLVPRDGRFVTTAIHFRRRDQFDPNAFCSSAARTGQSRDHHKMKSLVRNFGGWYPEPGQLVHCAQDHFELIAEEDGTEDYRRTSEYWLRRLKWSVATNPRVWLALARTARHLPRETWQMLRSHLWDQAWYWQFRPPAPMRLLRQTWLAR